jgi:pimeloyl-ACP methyl ester carboxylesterase
VARLLGEFLDALDLREVTLVGTDTGGALVQLLLAEGASRVSRVVLTACDSFDNFLPPSIRALQWVARAPAVFGVAMQAMRARPVRWAVGRTLAKQGIPNEVTAEWARPLVSDRGVRRDLARFLAAIDSRETLAAAERLREFDKPVLLLWPRRAPFFPFAHAQRWVRLLPDARLVEVADSYTFVSEDQPELFADQLLRFAAAPSPAADGTGPR